MYNYDDSINILIAQFPSLKLIYKDDIDYYEGLPYVFYEEEFSKFIMDNVKAYNESELSTIFNFVEDMLKYGDSEIRNLVGVAVIESLYYDSQFIWNDESLSKFYGVLIKQSFQECAQ